MTIKTTQTNVSVEDFIDEFAATPQKKQDGYELLKLMKDHTGYDPKMWGPSIIGFGLYHYKSERSRQEGDWPLVGFSPRKAAISLYVYSAAPGQDELLKQLGKFTMGKGCIYVKKLSDINTDILKEMISGTIDFLQKKWGKK
nr:DUF1801 domain-containing protein [uncultured Pedobacter sp.]